MTKNEFLDEIGRTLSGELPEVEIETNINFYDEYITSKSNNEEEDVLEQLGSPRLIAKTIIETYQVSHGPMFNNRKEKEYEDLNEANKNVYRNQKEDDKLNFNRNDRFMFQSNFKWYHKLILFLIILLSVILFIVIGGIVIKLFFSIGIPLIIVYIFYKLIKGILRR